MSFQYNSQAHIENNHSKHSLVHAYTNSGIYLGDVKELNLVTSNQFDKMERGGASVILESGICVVYKSGKIIQEYEPVYSQNGVTLGHILIRKNGNEETMAETKNEINAKDFIEQYEYEIELAGFDYEMTNRFDETQANLKIQDPNHYRIGGMVSVSLLPNGESNINWYSDGVHSNLDDALQMGNALQLAVKIAKKWESLHSTDDIDINLDENEETLGTYTDREKSIIRYFQNTWSQFAKENEEIHRIYCYAGNDETGFIYPQELDVMIEKGCTFFICNVWHGNGLYGHDTYDMHKSIMDINLDENE